MKVNGYKCFNKDKTNRYGMPFEEGKTYTVDGPIVFGNDGNGYHMATHLSDVFRYFDTENDNFTVAKVTGMDECVAFDDDYNAYYDMYACKTIRINHFMSREEIIDEMLKCNIPYQLTNFFRTFYLTYEEKVLFARKFRNNAEVIKSLLFYQFHYDRVFVEFGYQVDPEQLEKVLTDGQDSNQRGKGK
jgi:hypothetical protein